MTATVTGSVARGTARFPRAYASTPGKLRLRGVPMIGGGHRGVLGLVPPQASRAP